MEAAAAAPVSRQACAKSWLWLQDETSGSSHGCRWLQGAPGQRLVRLRDPRVTLICPVPLAAGQLGVLLPPVPAPGPRCSRLCPGRQSMSRSARVPTPQPVSLQPGGGGAGRVGTPRKGCPSPLRRCCGMAGR